MKRSAYIIIICIFSCLLGGCSASGVYTNYRGIEDMQLLSAIGIDAGGTGVILTVTSGKSADGSPPTVLSHAGFSVSKAQDSLQDYASSASLFYAHAQSLLIGQDAAERGIGDYLDYVARNTQMRMGISVYIVKDGSAKELITGSGDPSYDVAEALRSVRRDVDLRGDSHVYTCRDVMRSLAETGAALVCAVESAPTEGVVFSAQSGVTAIPAGYGIISDGALVGFVDGDRAVAVSLVLGGSGVGNLALHDAGGGEVTVEYELGGCTVRPHWSRDGGIEFIEVSAKVSGAIVEVGAPRRTDDEAYVRELEALLAEKLKSDVADVISLSGELRADFLKLGRAVKADSASKYAALGGHFADMIADIPFKITVDTTLERSYALSGTVSTDGSGDNYDAE